MTRASKLVTIAFAGLLALAAPDAASAETHVVRLVGFEFQPSELEIAAGDTVAWVNTGGMHNVIADDGGFTSGAPSSAAFRFEHTFELAGDFRYFCELHGAPGGSGMAGRIRVTPAASTDIAINEGLQGSWFNPETPGQGFFFDISPTQRLFGLAWFTWGAGGAYDWLTGAGAFDATVADLQLFRTVNSRRGGAPSKACAALTYLSDMI